jgi:transposase
MLFTNLNLRVFVYQGEIDMRSGFERLSYFIREEIKADILEGHMYLFLGKNRKRAKVLLFDRTGLVLIAKRMEGGKLMKFCELENVTEISISDLALILSGARIMLPVNTRKGVKTNRILE